MIHNSILRNGNYTSSEIVALTKLDKDGKSFGAPAMTYIEETNMERRLGLSLSEESNTRPLIWGKLLEPRAFDLLGLEYSLISHETIAHPEIPYWAGSPDGIKEGPEGKTVIDIKCPMTRKSFCRLVDDGTISAIRNEHKDGEKYYWQLVSNAILTGAKFAELIVYLPYLSELPIIRQMAQDVPADKMGKHYWIAMGEDDELPYLLDGGHYKNLNIISFEVPQADKDYLTEIVQKAGNYLVKNMALARYNDLHIQTTRNE